MSSRTVRKLTEVLFMVPCLLAFALVIVVPFVYGIIYSFTDWDGVKSLASAAKVGFANYSTIFSEAGFQHAFLITVEFTVLNVISVNVVAFLLALLVTSEIKGRNLFRAGFFVPNLIGGIVLGSIWQFIFAQILPNIGTILGWTGLQANLISQPSTVMITMVIVNTWQYAGYIMMIYVASIQGISKSVIEASQVDGAKYSTRIWHIQIPMMASSFTICMFLTLTNSFKMYDVNLALTNGGPAGLWNGKLVQMSELLALNIYNTAFKYSKMAQGQAKAVVFFVVLAIVSVIQVSINKRKELEM